MDRDTRLVATTAVLGAAAFGHALFTWPVAAVAVLFGGGTVLAFLGEVVVVSRGWLVHHLEPAVLGVPLYALLGWVATIYVAVRIALLVTAGWQTVVVAATLTTVYDIATDHYGVSAGFWTYTDDLAGPRFRGVPWWNHGGWFVVTGLTTALTLTTL